MACRVFGVEVEEFGIGFPPRLVKLFDAGGTAYTLNWLPLGGFVRPKGENDPEVEGGLASASPWVRIGVLIAGPLMNLLAAVVIYAVIFGQLGVPETGTVKILEVASDSPAQEAGLRAGDVIEEINQVPIQSSRDLRDEIYSRLGEKIEVVVQREGTARTYSLIPRQNPPEGEGAIGIVMTNPIRDIGVLEALPRGVSTTVRHSIAVLSLPANLIGGNSMDDVGRPVGYKGMYDVYQGATEQELVPGTSSLVNVLFFVAAITVSLGVLNMFPIPALDGGRILLILPEIILQRRVSQQVKNVVNAIGFISLILLLIYINILDFTSPIQLP